ncbi:hypothetical protein ATANTOWER_022806 [Ataeniobius toweri]|uniref:Uncharacterized protein n=1 Tax=Ataeniobius toweri TaxID=208326 RepID=A0ABU7A146_9TELE|nr:hypothetical protein [Ataeniobius toweri]
MAVHLNCQADQEEQYQRRSREAHSNPGGAAEILSSLRLLYWLRNMAAGMRNKSGTCRGLGGQDSFSRGQQRPISL